MSGKKQAVEPLCDDLVVILNKYLKGCDLELGIRIALLEELYRILSLTEVRGMRKAAWILPKEAEQAAKQIRAAADELEKRWNPAPPTPGVPKQKN